MSLIAEAETSTGAVADEPELALVAQWKAGAVDDAAFVAAMNALERPPAPLRRIRHAVRRARRGWPILQGVYERGFAAGSAYGRAAERNSHRW